MRAHLGHQEHAFAAIPYRLPHPCLALAVVVFPGVVKKRDARVDGLVDELCCFRVGVHLSNVKTTEPKRRHGFRMTPEGPARDLICGHTTRLCKRRTIADPDGSVFS